MVGGIRLPAATRGQVGRILLHMRLSPLTATMGCAI